MSPQLSSILEINLDYLAEPKQRRFHQSGAKYRLYIGAWRAGKTYAGCQEALKQSILYEKNVGLIGRKDFTDLRDTTIKTFFEVCPPEFIKNYNKTEHHVVFQNGSEIYFRELKDGVGLGSLNLGWFYIDEAEEVQESIFERLQGRLSLAYVGRQCGWLTSNPPNEDHWIYKRFEQSGDPDLFTVHASTYENKMYLPEGYITSLEKLPPSWRKKYLEGQYGFTPDGTPYYQGYVEHFHKQDLRWDVQLPLYCGWDSGRRHPAFVVTQWNNRVWKILAEVLGSEIGIEAFAETMVFPLLNRRFPGGHYIHCAGPEFEQKNDKSDYTSRQILASKKIRLYVKHSEYSLRKQIIERKLNTIVEGEPSLQVDSSCNIINDAFLGGYRYPERKLGQQFSFKYEIPFKDGFYEHCVCGETKIRTLDGWYQIKDLVGKEIITYAYDSFGRRLVPAKAHSIRKTQSNMELWKITFDKNELTATPDHLIMMRDGSYRMLKDLQPNDELMPFYEHQRSYQGHTTIQLNDGSVVDEHRYIYNWFIGSLRQGYHIHHKDGNACNNYPENLVQIEAKKHMADVYAKMRKEGKITNGSTNPWTQESRDKISRYMKARHSQLRRDKLCIICGNVYSGIPRQKYCSKSCLWKSRYTPIKVNHKVISVGLYGYGDTYNLEVDNYHNFPANGIMVHNCMNALEYVAIQLFSPIGPKQDHKVSRPGDYGSFNKPVKKREPLSSWRPQ